MDNTLYDEFNNMEARHWWFVGRRRTFHGLIKHYLQEKNNRKILDIGCGTGMNMDSLAEFGRVMGIDLSIEAIHYCFNKEYSLCQANMLNLPFQSETFDLVTAFDVVEHLEDDLNALKEVYRICNDNGVVVLAVPAFRFLWGEHDDLAHHIRRYTLGGLKSVVEESGFEILKISYNNFFLFPIGLVFRNLKRILRIIFKNKTRKSDFTSTAPPVVNPILREIYAFEGKLLKYFNLPFGLSIICVCRKSI